MYSVVGENYQGRDEKQVIYFTWSNHTYLCIQLDYERVLTIKM